MNYLLKLVWIAILWTSVSCTTSKKENKVVDLNEDHGLRLVSLVVEDIYKSSFWYQKKLGFQEDKPIVDYPDYGVKVGFLHLGNFHLELVETKGSVPVSSLPVPVGSTLNGVLKLGFMVQNLDSLYQALKKFDDSEFITGIQSLPEPGLNVDWPKQHFMMYDMDGNMLQFFSTNQMNNNFSVPEPWLLMVTVDNLENMSAWYESNFGFRYLDTKGEVGNQRAVLSKGNFILELYRPEKVAFYDFMEPRVEYLGFRKFGFEVDSIESKSAQLEKANTEVVMPIREGDMSWSSKSTIVKDLEGNWIQVLEPSK